jgi:hypothetical protein
VHALLADIVLALSMNVKHRGKLVQQVLFLDFCLLYYSIYLLY